jgi:nucleoid DNA-binding protein
MVRQVGAGLGGAYAAGAAKHPYPAQVVQKKDFVDRVLAATGATKAEARPIIEATLAQLGAALSAGETLAVPPLGRARVNLEKDQRGGDVITLRVRRRPGKDS